MNDINRKSEKNFPVTETGEEGEPFSGIEGGVERVGKKLITAAVFGMPSRQSLIIRFLPHEVLGDDNAGNNNDA